MLLLGQTLYPNPKLLGITLHKDLTLLDISFFYIFYIKTIDPRHRASNISSNNSKPYLKQFEDSVCNYKS